MFNSNGVSRMLLISSLMISIQQLRADTLIMSDGSTVEGTVIDETPESVTLKVKFGKVIYKRSEIKEIKKAGGASAAETGPMRDILKLKSGAEHEGLLVSQTDKEVVFDIIMSGKKFSKTMITRSTFSREEVADLKELSDKNREVARALIDNQEAMAQQDTVTEKSIEVLMHEWPTKDGKTTVPCRKVLLDNFTIESDTPDDFLRKAAFRLAKVFNAYKAHFGVDRNETTKVRLVLFNSTEEYQASIGGSIKNPAFYRPDMKLISGGCDVAKYEAQIDSIKEYHLKLDQLLDQYKRHINDARMNIAEQVAKYRDAASAGGGKGMTAENKAMMDAVNQSKIRAQLELGEWEKKANAVQDEIYGYNRRNDQYFNEYTQYMFAMLYHEGFHAFLAFLFPEGQSRYVPRWLNEGLAQYFECARIENDRFILGQEERNKMAMLRKFRKDGGIIPLEKLVNGGADDYMVHDIKNVEHSTKNYFQAWNLVHWLGDHGRLKKDIMQSYVKALMDGKSQLDALQILSGVPNEQLEAELDQNLKPSFDQKEPKDNVPPDDKK